MHEVWFLYTTTWFLGQINFLSSWVTKKMQLWYDCFKHCIRDPRSPLSISFSYSFKSTVSTMARITECFSATTSCKIFSTIHKSIEADRGIFTRHFFSAFWRRRGLIQTWLAIKLRIQSSSPHFFSRHFVDEVSSWVVEDLLPWQFALVLKMLSTGSRMPRSAHGRRSFLSGLLACSWTAWEGRKVKAALWWLQLARAMGGMDKEERSLWSLWLDASES